MLIVFLLFALFRLPKGAPLTDNHVDTSELIGDGPSLLPRADITFGTRQTSDIVISCLATIFACTWTAVHPDIPSQMYSRWDKCKRRFILTTYTLLVPEFITAWALRQYLAARAIVGIYNSEIATQTHRHRDFCSSPPLKRLWRGVKEWLLHAPPLTSTGEVAPWTMTHAFFVQMGGFVLCENGKPSQTASFGRSAQDDSERCSDPEMKTGLKYLILSKTVDAPRITADEINDRSKGDAISKGLAIFQTTWFIIQCFARWLAHISVTELEIVTLAFAMLNGIAYVLWWNKPQNVGFPVYLEKRAPPFVSLGNVDVDQSPLAAEESQNVPGKPESTLLKENEITSVTLPDMIQTPARAHLANRRVSNDSGIMLGAQVIEGNGFFTTEKINHNDIKTVPEIHNQAGTAIQLEKAQEDNKPSEPSLFHAALRLLQRLRTIWALSKAFRTFFSTSKHIIFKACSRIRKLHGGEGIGVPLGASRVPMFHVQSGMCMGRTYRNIITYLSTICLLFGCAHFIPSFFLYFPSRTEMWLWRISAAVITTQPAVYLISSHTVWALIVSYDERGHMTTSSTMSYSNIRRTVSMIFLNTTRVVVTHGAPFSIYIIARITLIALSFLSLRDLPDDAFSTIDWVSSIPHL